LAVRVVGMMHGILFILYVAAVFRVVRHHSWPWRRTALVLVASLLPAGPFVVEARILRREATAAR
jgi:integral membrane protein